MEGLEGVKQEVPHIFIHVHTNDAPIEVVYDTATVHHLSNQILEAVPGYPSFLNRKCLRQISVDNLHAYIEIRFIEIVRNVPSYFVIFPSLL